MDIYWVFILAAIGSISNVVAIGSNTASNSSGQNDKANALVTRLNDFGDVKAPSPKDEHFRVYTTVYAAYRIHQCPTSLWETEHQISLLQKKIPLEQNPKEKETLNKKLQLLQEYKKILLRDEQAEKQRLLNLSGKDLNNLEEALKLLDALRVSARGGTEVPDVLKEKVFEKCKLLSELKEHVEAMRIKDKAYPSNNSDVNKYIKEYDGFLFAIQVMHSLRTIYLEEKAQRTYFDVARRTLGVAKNPQEFRKKLFNNEDLNVQSVLYNIHYMNAVEKADLETVGKLLKQYPNENSGAVLRELIGKGIKERDEEVFKDLEVLARELKVKITVRSTDPAKQERNQQPNIKKPQQQDPPTLSDPRKTSGESMPTSTPVVQVEKQQVTLESMPTSTPVVQVEKQQVTLESMPTSTPVVQVEKKQVTLESMPTSTPVVQVEKKQVTLESMPTSTPVVQLEKKQEVTLEFQQDEGKLGNNESSMQPYRSFKPMDRGINTTRKGIKRDIWLESYAERYMTDQVNVYPSRVYDEAEPIDEPQQLRNKILVLLKNIDSLTPIRPLEFGTESRNKIHLLMLLHRIYFHSRTMQFLSQDFQNFKKLIKPGEAGREDYKEEIRTFVSRIRKLKAQYEMNKKTVVVLLGANLDQTEKLLEKLFDLKVLIGLREKIRDNLESLKHKYNLLRRLNWNVNCLLLLNSAALMPVKQRVVESLKEFKKIRSLFFAFYNLHYIIIKLKQDEKILNSLNRTLDGVISPQQLKQKINENPPILQSIKDLSLLYDFRASILDGLTLPDYNQLSGSQIVYIIYETARRHRNHTIINELLELQNELKKQAK